MALATIDLTSRTVFRRNSSSFSTVRTWLPPSSEGRYGFSRVLDGRESFACDSSLFLLLRRIITASKTRMNAPPIIAPPTATKAKITGIEIVNMLIPSVFLFFQFCALRPFPSAYCFSVMFLAVLTDNVFERIFYNRALSILFLCCRHR